MWEGKRIAAGPQNFQGDWLDKTDAFFAGFSNVISFRYCNGWRKSLGVPAK